MCARIRVLVVNDDDDALFLLGRSLRRALPDAEIAQVNDSSLALDYCREHHVDALVTDNTMPVMDGLALTRAVRASGGTMPILMVTNSTHLATEAADAGVTAYLPSARWSEVGAVVASMLHS